MRNNELEPVDIRLLDRAHALEVAWKILTAGPPRTEPVDSSDLISVASWIYDGKDPWEPTYKADRDSSTVLVDGQTVIDRQTVIDEVLTAVVDTLRRQAGVT